MHKYYSSLALIFLAFTLTTTPACKSSQHEKPENNAPKIAPPKANASQESSEPLAPEQLPPIVLDKHGEYPWYHEKIGPIQKGQSPQEVEKLLGKPTKVSDEDFSPATGAYFVYWTYDDPGIEIT